MESKAIERERREARRAAELRENLRRRKQQSRDRVIPAGEEPASPNSAGIGSENGRDKATDGRGRSF